MLPDHDVVFAPAHGHDRDPLARARVRDDKHFVREPRTELPVQPSGIGCSSRPDIGILTAVDQSLDMDMCDGLLL